MALWHNGADTVIRNGVERSLVEIVRSCRAAGACKIMTIRTRRRTQNPPLTARKISKIETGDVYVAIYIAIFSLMSLITVNILNYGN